MPFSLLYRQVGVFLYGMQKEKREDTARVDMSCCSWKDVILLDVKTGPSARYLGKANQMEVISDTPSPGEVAVIYYSEMYKLWFPYCWAFVSRLPSTAYPQRLSQISI